MTSVLYAGGRFLPADAAFLTAEDRSFRFGDGIFDTAIIHNGKVFDWPAHAARLERGMAYFSLPYDMAFLPRVTEELIARNAVVDGYLRVVISRGENPPEAIGYKPAAATPSVVVQAVSKLLPAFSRISLHISDVKMANVFPCKTNSAIHYTLAFLQAEAAGCDNALLLDGDGHICETANGNLCWIEGDTLYIPAEDLPMVPGTVQKRVLSLWGGKICAGKYTPEVLKSAEEILMMNVGGLITSVSHIPSLGIERGSVVRTQQLREALVECIRKETA